MKLEFTRKVNVRSLTLNSIPVALALFLFWSSCEDSVNEAQPSNVVFPDSGVSYARHVEVLFSQSCASAKCHGGVAPAASLNLERPSWSALMDHSPRLVLSGDPDNSLLIMWMDGRKDPRMPLRMDPLTDNQLKGIRQWIKEKALNN